LCSYHGYGYMRPGEVEDPDSGGQEAGRIVNKKNRDELRGFSRGPVFRVCGVTKKLH